jgi:hypothetical protein
MQPIRITAMRIPGIPGIFLPGKEHVFLIFLNKSTISPSMPSGIYQLSIYHPAAAA